MGFCRLQYNHLGQYLISLKSALEIVRIQFVLPSTISRHPGAIPRCVAAEVIFVNYLPGKLRGEVWGYGKGLATFWFDSVLVERLRESLVGEPHFFGGTTDRSHVSRTK
eukprot:Blabericola_migrator_1__53@NODE_1011_length_5710_cov_146_189615_g538_i1_p5_GENE_NODE_1011_length_5710_cov_146_189615_g538_i1NODE_1011_length_5710_cov_146_189615_g538_i1_p5_ORF_typecomplete_len109_score0_27_NODE_1011_length_5710_cov_146_189615_g538_i124442770